MRDRGRTLVTPRFKNPLALSRTFTAGQNVDRVLGVNTTLPLVPWETQSSRGHTVGPVVP